MDQKDSPGTPARATQTSPSSSEASSSFFSSPFSPGDHGSNIFSPTSSVYSDLTDEYELTTPTRNPSTRWVGVDSKQSWFQNEIQDGISMTNFAFNRSPHFEDDPLELSSSDGEQEEGDDVYTDEDELQLIPVQCWPQETKLSESNLAKLEWESSPRITRRHSTSFEWMNRNDLLAEKPLLRGTFSSSPNLRDQLNHPTISREALPSLNKPQPPPPVSGHQISIPAIKICGLDSPVQQGPSTPSFDNPGTPSPLPQTKTLNSVSPELNEPFLSDVNLEQLSFYPHPTDKSNVPSLSKPRSRRGSTASHSRRRGLSNDPSIPLSQFILSGDAQTAVKDEPNEESNLSTINGSSWSFADISTTNGGQTRRYSCHIDFVGNQTFSPSRLRSKSSSSGGDGNGTTKHSKGHMEDDTNPISLDVQIIDETLATILPHDLRDRLDVLGTKCVANKRTLPERCGNFLGDKNRVRVELDNLRCRQPDAVEEHIDRLVRFALCTRHHRKRALDEFENWRGLLHGDGTQKDGMGGNRARYAGLIRWVKALKGDDSEDYRDNSGNDEASLSTIKFEIDSKHNNDESKPVKYEHSHSTEIRIYLPESTGDNTIGMIQTLIPYCLKKNKNLTIQQALEKLVQTPITAKRTTKKGYMYVFWYPGNFGRIKIGRTSNIETRLNKWAEKCAKNLTILFPLEDQDKQSTMHCSRVENLIHTELMKHRRQVAKCETCGSSHIEWFEGDKLVTKSVVVEIIRKWMNWMRESPYEKREKSNGKVQWVLKEGLSPDVQQICRPHEKLMERWYKEEVV